MPRILLKLSAALVPAAAAVAALLRRRRRASSAASMPAPPAPAATPPGPPTAVQATPPPEVPGPSVTPPQAGGSSAEAEERADALKPEHLPGDTEPATVDETRVEDEAAAAASEAGAIGGPAPDGPADEAMRPVYEAGGGEQEGFEAAEEELIENATHGDGNGNPLRDAFPAEAESDLSDATYAEPDTEHKPD